MSKKKSSSQRWRRSAISVAASLTPIIGGTFIMGGNANAQEGLSRVEVTGSRIATPNAESSSPVTVLTAAEIAASGVTNLQDLLLKIPSMGSPTLSRTNSNFLTSSVGVATIDLRNLGTSRTLVLVNGRRFVSGVPGDSAVDFNSIPTEFIERIEILTGGASSTYGSDAVAGVVNIILKRDFEGVAIDAHVGQSGKGDDRTKRFGITFGASAPEGKGNVMGYIGYSKQGAVYSKDRSFSAIDQASEGAFFSGDKNDFFTPRKPFYSGFAPPGAFFTDNNAFTFDKDGQIIPRSTNGPAGDGVGATGFNRSEFRSIAVPTERFLFSSKGDYALNANHSAFFEGTYASSQTKSKLEPFPLAGEDIFPATGGQVPAEFLYGGSVIRNPYVPNAIYSDISDTDGDGLKDFYFTRRLAEVGNRGSVAGRDTYRFVTGFKGDLSPKWNYEVYGGYGATKESQTSNGQVNVLNFRNALSAVTDPLTGQAVCVDPNAVAQGCVPINIFGFNSISPAALAYVQAPGSLNTFTSQKLYGGTITGEPMMLPAGPLGLAIGGEYRDEYSKSEFDALTQAGLNGGNKLPTTEGSFDVLEVFAEARVPLLKNAAFAKALTATAAVRIGNYSTVGNTTSWNAGVEWSVNSDFKFRATRALSTRAPNIGELYSPPSQTFPDVTDPCLGVTAGSVGAKDDACRAAPGVAANIAANGAFALNQADLQGVSGFDRGNPNVEEEKGKSFTLGFAFTPQSIDVLRNFGFTVDYFNIKIDDAIVGTPRSFILNQCYGGDSSLCQFITRRPAAVGANSAGSLEYVDSGVSNSGVLATKGLDFAVAHSAKVGPGQLNTRLAWTHLLGGYLTPLPGASKDYFEGEVGAAKDKASLTLGYQWGAFGITSQTTYIGKSYLDDIFLLDYGYQREEVSVKAKVYNDFQFTYSPTKAVQIYLGIDNAFDTKPVPLITGLPGSDTGVETAAGVYDPIGRRYNFGARLKF